MIIRVAIVDDYEVVVRGLVTMLRSYREAVKIVELDVNSDVDSRVDLALYDTFANPQGDREKVRQLASSPLVGKVVVYSWNLEPTLIRAALANGASGYISKALPAREMVTALLSVHRGGQNVWAGRSRAVVGGDWPGREEGLTPREAEVLALITQGLSNNEIAERANLSINSVKSYIRSCYRRIGVSSRSNAVLWGVEHGFRPERQRIHPD